MKLFNGLGSHLGNLSRLSNAVTRSISAENFTGAKGAGGMATEGTGRQCAADLGVGWKVSPSIVIPPGGTVELAQIEGSGALQHLWLTGPHRRLSILRIYWDGQEHPSVEVPLGDFFASASEPFAQVSSLPICVNPGRGFNSYWEMPFRKRCRITLTNLHQEAQQLYYQITYALTEVSEDQAYFHARFRRSNPLPYKAVHTILDGVSGKGQFVGTSMFWGVNNCGWWGEGEVKFYLDGDGDFPTICGTGTEDYFCGAYNFENSETRRYQEFTTPYSGMPQVIRPDGLYQSQTRFQLYRWHMTDPIRFDRDCRVTIQALGWRNSASGPRYLPLQDDISSVAYWYQTLPTVPFPPLADREFLEII